MWLDIHKRYDLVRYDPQQSAQQWRVDVRACGHDLASPDFVVGRLMADQIDIYDAEEWGHNPFDSSPLILTDYFVADYYLTKFVFCE